MTLKKSFNSITTKLLLFILCVFIAVILCVMVLSRNQFTRIIDTSQNTIYEEKIDVIWSIFKQANERLQKTGHVELYGDDFRKAAIAEIQKTHFNQKGRTLSPLVFNEKGRAVAYSGVIPNERLHDVYEQIGFIQGETGQFTLQLDQQPTWYRFKHFRPWGWTIAYAVPLDIKYADVKRFLTLLFITLVVITFFAILALSFMVTRLIRPVDTLKDIAMRIADGDLDHPIDISGRDEIGKLAESFDVMRNVIRDQIARLNNEIVERKKVEVELRGLRNYLKNIIDSMPSMLVGLDSNGRVTQWNRTAETVTGVSADYAYMKTLAEVLPRVASEQSLIDESIATKEIQRIGKKIHQGESGIKYENITIYPLKANEVTGVVIRVDDVTREHELEMELNHSRKMDAIGQLAGGVAHDFNNMLAGITGAAQLLKNPERKVDKQGLKFVDMIQEASMRASDLTNKLLAFGRKGKVASSTIDINRLVDDTVALLRHSIDKKINIVVHRNVENDHVVGDSSELQNALLNIGINASHAMPQGGELLIEISNVRIDQSYCDLSGFDISPGEFIEIELRDTGYGIPQDNLQNIFEPFFTTKEQGQGVGLGLAAVYGTLKDHQGAITVYSEVGTGTTFQLLLPCSDEPHGTEHYLDEIISGSGRILIVDDEEVIRATGKYMLEEMGYEVVLAENGQKAVAFFRNTQDPVDLVIMDMNMPVMNGKEAIAEIRKLDQDCSIIIASGFSRRDQLADLEQYNLIGFLRKPYRANELSSLLATALVK